jgi:site-specific recombinase XerD
MAEGERAASRYVEFFTAQIRNSNTRLAYARAASNFFAWCEQHGLALPAVQPVHVATYIEGIGRELSAPSVKQQLAAIRMLFDWLVVGQVVPHNPAAPVRGPKHSTAKGKTRMPTRDEAKALLASIPTTAWWGCATAR